MTKPTKVHVASTLQPQAPTAAPATLAIAVVPTGTESGVRIAKARVLNYRCLKSVEVDLGDLTVLIGENNAGKTSFISALSAALGDRGRGIDAEDVYIAPHETRAPDTRNVIIDILLVPADPGAFNGKWTKTLGSSIEMPPGGGEQVTIRTIREWNSSKGEHDVKRAFLSEWPATAADMPSATIHPTQRVTGAILEALALYVVDARRDIRDDLRTKNSFWARMTNELQIPEATVLELEATLSTINARIMSESPILKHVQTHLDDLVVTLAGTKNSVTITPVTRQLRDIQEGMDILFATTGAQAFPLARHGMGTRSLASILTFRAYMKWKQNHLGNDVLHPFLALEEPEAHLHPQAQRAIFREALNVPGQRIISTHSPYVAGQAPIANLRHFKRNGPETVVTKLDASHHGLEKDDIRAIEQAVIETRGELLFARGIVLFEGETEEAAMPIFAEKYWGTHPSTHGLSLVPCYGQNYKPFLRLANAFEIPWFILSDGEKEAVDALESALVDIGAGTPTTHPHVTILPNGTDFERYLVAEGYIAELEQALSDAHDEPNYLDTYIHQNHGQKKKGGAIRDYKTAASGRADALIDALHRHKTMCAKPVAKRIIQTATPSRRVPPAIRQIYDAVADRFQLSKWSGTA